jgi:hypothetical protein
MATHVVELLDRMTSAVILWTSAILSFLHLPDGHLSGVAELGRFVVESIGGAPVAR